MILLKFRFEFEIYIKDYLLRLFIALLKNLFRLEHENIMCIKIFVYINIYILIDYVKHLKNRALFDRNCTFGSRINS